MYRAAVKSQLAILLAISWAAAVFVGPNFTCASEGATEDYSLWKVDKFTPSPAIAVPLYASPTRESVSLDGTWQVRMDPTEKGFAERWFARLEVEFPDRLEVPGNWIAQGLGGAGVPFDLEDISGGISGLEMRTATLKGSYLGLAWYRKSFSVPATWQDRQVRLVFGAVLNSVRLWVNGEFVGGRWTDGNSFYFDVSGHIKPGRTNTVVIAIDNRMKEAATRSHLQWYVANGGPYHHVMLWALPELRIEKALVRPVLQGAEGPGIAEVHVSVTNASGSNSEAEIEIQITSLQKAAQQFKGSTHVNLKAGKASDLAVPIPIDPVEVWSPDHPNLYKLTVQVRAQELSDSVTERFGMRTVASLGNRFQLNQRPVFIQGLHLNFFWPNTFTPPITKEEYRKHLQKMKDYGFNYLRTPWLMPEECYQAADEVGMMLQLEFPFAFEPYDKIKLQLNKRLIEECLVAYGNHPSLVLLTMSNEGSWDKMGGLNPQFCAFSKAIDPTRLVMDTDGTNVGGEFTEKVTDAILAEVVSTGNQMGVWSEYMSNVARQSDIYRLRPVIDHEFLNVPSLVDLEIVKSFRDPVLKPPAGLGPKFLEQIQKQGMEKEYPLYLKASHHHQADFIREGMERSRKNPLKAGFSMCAWNDIEQGVHWGILDAFMDTKGITADAMRVYNSQNVLLVDSIDLDSGEIQLVTDYCRALGKEFSLQPYVSYFGHESVTNAILTWRIQDESQGTLAEGRIENVNLALATVTTLPRIVVRPMAGTKAQEAVLRLKLSGAGLELQNSWPIWLFPPIEKADVGRRVYASGNVIAAVQRVVKDVAAPEVAPRKGKGEDLSLWVTDEPGLALYWLQGGKNVLFVARGDTNAKSDWPDAKMLPNPFDPGWFKSDDHMGSIIRAGKALGDFPHKGYASWQFRYLINRAKGVPEGPIVAKPVISSAFNDSMPHVQHQLFVARTNTGGHLTYCQLKVLSGRSEADYLLLQLTKNAGLDKSDPLVELDQLRPYLASAN
jgi:beta-galactosidase/beta-glucuronidase